MKRVLFLIAQKNFRDEELKEPMNVFKGAGYSICIASESTQIAEGMLGAQVKPDMSFSEAYRCMDEFSALIIVGGSGALGLANNSYVIRIVKYFYENNKVVGAICYGPIALARAGILSGRRATVAHSTMDSDSIKSLRSGGAVFTDQKVVDDGKIVTANGPSAALEFSKVLLSKLG